jgi:hypothetical protein
MEAQKTEIVVGADGIIRLVSLTNETSQAAENPNGQLMTAPGMECQQGSGGAYYQSPSQSQPVPTPLTAVHQQQANNVAQIPPLLSPAAILQLLNAAAVSNGSLQYIQQNGSTQTPQEAPFMLPQSYFNMQQLYSTPPPTVAASSIVQAAPERNRSHMLYLEMDDDNLSAYQCLVRKHIEIFEASEIDLRANAQGRNKPICLGQVGIRCRHCGFRFSKERAKGAVYFPSQLSGLYQTAQNMANSHLIKDCFDFPEEVREDLVRLREKKSSVGGGSRYVCA